MENAYRPDISTYELSFPTDIVDDHAAEILQKCAIEAVKHPFEVTYIEE